MVGSYRVRCMTFLLRMLSISNSLMVAGDWLVLSWWGSYRVRCMTDTIFILHRLSISNSLMVALFLVGLVGVIMVGFV